MLLRRPHEEKSLDERRSVHPARIHPSEKKWVRPYEYRTAKHVRAKATIGGRAT